MANTDEAGAAANDCMLTIDGHWANIAIVDG
jgi:hypothetical protein